MNAALVLAGLGFTTLAACGGDGGGEPGLPGGAATVFDRSSNAYSFPAPELAADELALHLEGDAAFEAEFVTAPAPVNPGLGPVFNNSACVNCHARDGRGLPVTGNGFQGSQALVRVSLVDGEPVVPGGAVEVPGMGTQIQDHAIFGVPPEATVELAWIERGGAYADGTTYLLREPRALVTLPGGEALADEVMTSLRQPPPVFGLGLLEAVPEEAILALADADDADGDGISGRANYVWDARDGATVLGRFGHKANTPTLRQQAAAAYANDMGVSSSVFPDEGGAADLDDEILDATTFYTRTLAVPARAEPADDAAAERAADGEALFSDLGCAGCHAPALFTGDSDVATLTAQHIQPYTDLLVHDLGPDLADERPDFGASGREWRTAPLWGIGLVQTVLPYASYLHDGRARTLEEAILWHGGEAEVAREAFRTADSDERAALVEFLQTL